MVLGTARFRLPMRRHRRYQQEYENTPVAGFGSSALLPTAAGTGTADLESTLKSTVGRAVFVGVTTGVLVWTITRILDRIFKIERRT